MIEVGRLVVKLAGRDAGLKGVVVEILEGNYVLVDGQVRRRKCNILHLEPLEKVVKIKAKASHADVIKALKEEGIEVVEKKSKQKTERPKKQRKGKKKTEKTTEEPKPKKEAKKPAKKEEKE
jgi:large subunit ribosomal protein L14e